MPKPTLKTRFCYYAILIEPDVLWNNGENLSIHHNVDDAETRLFEDESKKIWNSKGTFKGYSGNKDLWKEAKSKHNNPLAYLKTLIKE